MIVLLLIVLAALVLFFTEWVEVEVTAILVMAALLVTGTLTPAEALSGFSSEATVVVAGLLIMSSAIERTGALQVVANRFMEWAHGRPQHIATTGMVATGFLSMFLNNTPTVAVQLPIALSLAGRTGVAVSKLLMPISFAAILGGTCTMIGTSTNILVRTIAAEHDWSIGVFDVTPMGLIYFGVGLLYLLVIGRRLVPDRQAGENLAERFHLREYVTEIEVGPDARLVGHACGTEVVLTRQEQLGFEILSIHRGDERLRPEDAPILEAGDLLVVRAEVENLLKLRLERGLRIVRDFQPSERDLANGQSSLVEAVLSPTSRLLGSTLSEAACRQRYGVTALAVRRHGHIMRGRLDPHRLDFGDSLLLQGTANALQQIKASPDFLLLEQVQLPQPRPSKIPIAVGILAITVALMGAGLVPLVTGVVVGSVAMVLTRCVSLREVYESFPFKVIILLGCLIPLGVAVETTGAADYVAARLVNLPLLGSPRLLLLALALVTIGLTEVMSNNATAVLVVPIAFAVAEMMGVSPQPLVLGVMFTASFSFLTPVGYQTNTLIYGPGGYRFSDFARVGAPLTATLLLLTTLIVPMIWPF